MCLKLHHASDPLYMLSLGFMFFGGFTYALFNLCVSMCVCGYSHISARLHRGRRHQIPLELELQVDVNPSPQPLDILLYMHSI